jgi:hypothetical protein
MYGRDFDLEIPRKRPSPVFLPQYFASDTNLMQARTLLYTNGLQKKYPPRDACPQVIYAEISLG